MNAHPPYLTDDLSTIELEQARLLRQNAVRSCITVEAVIVYLTIMIWAFGRQETALGWFVATSSMVLVSYLYSRYRVQGELNSENHKAYLRGHIIVCAITGAVWGGFASLQISPDNQLSLFVASNIVFAITVGGMLPGSEYRPGFIALATFCILPFTFFWFTRTEGVIQVAALGILLYYAFGLMVSAQTDRDIRDGITARQNQALMKELVERNQQIERANEERARFLAATSHDLAQPLHAQGFFINALRSRLNDDGQRELLDRSYQRMREGRQPGPDSAGQQGQGHPQPRMGQQGQHGSGMSDTALQQQLQQELNELMQRYGEAMGDVPGALPRAEGAMGRSAKALERGRNARATRDQGEALDQLQSAAQDIRRQILERFAGEGALGQQLRGENGEGGRDPLGREAGSSSRNSPEGQVTIPKAGDIQRARQIRDELRRRSGQRGRDPVELEYIDRLLQPF